MNETKGLRQRKQSLNKPNTRDNTKLLNSDIKSKSSLSLTKKISQEMLPNTYLKNNYLLGWGKLPFVADCLETSVQTINKNVVNFAVGEQHIVFVTPKGEVYGIGDSTFGQLSSNKTIKGQIIPIMQQQKVKNVYATPFCTFLQTTKQQIYACGLNNRGQLGIGNQLNVFAPVLIDQLTKDVKINEIVDVVGGPFHTAMLTAQGKVFYTGNSYKASSLLTNQCLTSFQQLPISSPQIQIISIKSSLTGLVLCSSSHHLHLFGLFQSTLPFQQLFLITDSQCKDYAVDQKNIYLIDQLDQVQVYCIEGNVTKSRIIKTCEKIKSVVCGLDYCLLISYSNSIYGIGNNSTSQLSEKKKDKYFYECIEIDYASKITLKTVKCSINFVVCLSTSNLTNFDSTRRANRVFSQAKLTDQPTANSLKIKQLEKENKLFKDMLNRTKKSVRVQTDKQSKFDLNKLALNARTFDNSLEIPFEQLQLEKQISQGGYGVIYEAKWRKTTVAVKLFKIEQDSQNSIKDFISECHAMEILRHPNIVMFLGACTKGPNFAIVLEYCQGGTLWAILQRTAELSWLERKTFALQIARGMNYLHERSTPILHRDLKSLNILLDNNKRVKLADFGWTKGLQNYMTGKIGTYQWMAPQVISAQQYTEKADVFSYGIILWEIASREAPYRNIPGAQVAQDVLHKDLRPTIPKKTPQQFSDLMRKCWSKHASSRPSFSEIITILQKMKFS